MITPKKTREFDWSKYGPRLAWSAVALQLVTALFIRGGDGRNYYPFFRWDLFPSLSSVASDYDVLITKINGQPIDPPLSYRYAGKIFPTAVRYEPYVVIQTLGYHNGKRHRRIWQEAKALFDHDLLGNGLYNGVVVRSVSYNIVWVKYDPKERYLHHAPPMETTEIATFEVQP